MIRTLFFLFIYGFSITVYAAAATVYDPLNFVQNKLNAVQIGMSNINERINNQAQIVQIKVALNTLYQMREQYQQLVYTYESLTGKYGYGQYLTGPARFADPSYHPNTTDEMAQQFREGGKDGVYGEQVDVWREKYGDTSDDTYWCVEGDCPLGESAKDRSNSAMALGTSSEVVYNNIRTRGTTIDKISKQINETDNIKQSMDLQNTLMAELASMMNDMLRLQALNSKANAAGMQHDINKERAGRKFTH